MTRPTRGERLASPKGRPKRQAARTHFFKYQLSSNPSRVEENDLKRALQESLADQSSDMTRPKSKGRQLFTNKNNRVMINSSTNSSDVSRISNSSSSSSNKSRSTPPDLLSKRTRSCVTVTDMSLQSPVKRVKLINGQKKNISAGSEKNRCDNELSVLSESLSAVLPQVNKAIRTYSRSQPQELCSTPPRSSTPLIKKHHSSNGIAQREEKSSTVNTNGHVYVSKSTQTSAPKAPKINSGSANSSQLKSNSLQMSFSHPKDDLSVSTLPQPPSVQQQYLKFKRESKNYAYAKMTALRVSTSKSSGGNSSKSAVGPKKTINGSIGTAASSRDLSKSGPKAGNSNQNSSLSQDPKLKHTNSSQSHVPKHMESKPTSSRKTPSPSYSSKALQAAERLLHNGRNDSKLTQTTPPVDTEKNLQKDSSINQDHQSSESSYGGHDFSTGKGGPTTTVEAKKSFYGSWSLLGVPEEKIIYLRDDEPPKRLICYPAIKHIEGDVIQVRDSVLLRSGAKKTDIPYIAKICSFWDDPEIGVMMSLLWYYRPEHTEEGRKPHHLYDEVFASRHRDVDSVECIEDKCYVLTFNEYCRYRKRCKMEQVQATWSLADVTIPVSNESNSRKNRIPDSDVNPELVFCCRQIYDSRMRRLVKNPLINPKYGHI